MFPRRNPLRAARMPQANTTSFPPVHPQTDQQPTHPHELDEAHIKRMFGFDADDPNVEVHFIPLGGTPPLEDILSGAAGLSNVTADGNNADSNNGSGETYAPDSDTRKKSLAGFERLESTKEATLDLVTEVMREVMRATMKHSPQHSPHEGHSVIREELEELWQHVKADTGRSPEARKEAIQTAAMAVRYVLDNIDAPA